MFSITEGIVSGYSDVDEDTQGVYLITDAKIDSGNSGGAAITTSGDLVGLPTFLVGNKQVLGYIIDLNRIEEYTGKNI